jgi:hypothetical protein
MATIGEAVHFVMHGSGEERPAIVVKAWADGSANLSVFLDDSDGYAKNQPVLRVQRVNSSDLQMPGTWHPADAADVIPTEPSIEVRDVITKMEEAVAMAKNLKPVDDSTKA